MEEDGNQHAAGDGLTSEREEKQNQSAEEEGIVEENGDKNAESDIEPDDEIIEDEETEVLKNLTAEDVIGRKFNSTEEAYDFYNKYARAWGFSVRREKKTETKKGETTSRLFVCSCAGTKRKSKDELQRPSRLNTRFQCKARLRVQLDKSDSKYIVDTFYIDHTHNPIRQKLVHHMRSHRGLDEATKAKVRYQRDAGMKTADIMNQHVHQAGGYDKVGHTKKDLHNFASKDRGERISEGDAATALAYLKSKISGDNHFVLEPIFDEDKRLHSIFWADSMSVADMACFGDLLAFDSTYKKNVYNMPLVVFSGAHFYLIVTTFIDEIIVLLYFWYIRCT
ncbi:unnamed protein product [Linum trigynum]|uniref:FAR1 domain-containing protein n=1 Tax=Linum trigynum TaxID=586398 RepID=A0AAV2G9P8_9ROSI